MKYGTIARSFRCQSLLLLLGFFQASVALAQSPNSADSWSGSVQCQLDVQLPGYVRQEMQTWTLTGEPPSRAGGTGVFSYPATWAYSGQGSSRQMDGMRGTMSQWQINIVPGDAPFAINVRDGVLQIRRASGQQKRNTGLTGMRQNMVNGVSQSATPLGTTSQLWEWGLPVIEAAPGANVSGTFPVRAENVGEIQQPGPPPFATCKYQFAKSGGNLANAAQNCPASTNIAQTVDNMKANLARDFDSLLQQTQDPARRTVLTNQKQRMLRELDLLKQQGVGSTACQSPPGSNVAQGTTAPGTTPGTPPGQNSPGQGTAGTTPTQQRTPPAQLVSITPNSVDQGSPSVQIALVANGTNWQAGTTKVDLGPGITPLTDPIVTKPGEAYVIVAVAPDAAPGPRRISVTANSQSVAMPSAFTVNAKAASTPAPGSTSPTNGLIVGGQKTIYEGGGQTLAVADPAAGGPAIATDPNNGTIPSNATATPVLIPPATTTEKLGKSLPDKSSPGAQKLDPGSLAPRAAPTGFAAKDLGSGAVQFTWQPVSGATQYYFEGTGIAPGGVKVAASSTGVTINAVPPGAGSWKMAAVYGGSWDPKLMATASAMVRYVPAHSPAWLSKPGQGNGALTIAHYLSLCSGCVPGIGWTKFLELIGGVGARIGYNCSVGSYDSGCPEPPYTNVTDLGTKRSTACYALTAGGTLCYTRSGDQGLTVIVTRQDQWWFFAFNGPNPDGPFTLADRATFDSEGAKFAPHACIACHGGQIATSGVVNGSTFLPLDPGLLQISTVTTFEDGTYYPNVHPVEWVSEKLIRPLNTQVILPNSSPAVRRHIRGIYGNDLNGQANPDFVPQGWTSQAGLYRQVIKPHCLMCHMSSTSTIDFSTFDTLLRSKQQVHSAVCSARSMPHAEIPFKDFWGKDTGQVSLPGVLDATLGFQSCP